MTSTPLAAALEIAQGALWLSDPNPRVGCLITSADGHPLGQGHTQQAGGPHAEIMALQDARKNGHSVAGATAYVTLEPCCHHGRTGPCCEALVQAGIRKVVVCYVDPNPLVSGQGIAHLRKAGMQVEVLPAHDPLALAARELNIGFFSRMVRKTPWVRLKIAASLDGKTALPNGSSQWITAEQARRDGHAWRARASAILTGIGTVVQDRPRLDVRLLDSQAQPHRQPHLVVVDSQLETPLDSPIFLPCRKLLIYAAQEHPAKAAALAAQGASIIYLPGYKPDGTPTRKVDLPALLRDLGQREINELHVEAGHKLNGSLVREGLVDEFLLYLAPKLLGQGADMASFGPLHDLAQALPLHFQSTALLGPDLRVLARVAGRGDF
ncbi:MAG: bifunctional diaminohydroxyphosphoribosylaminopyrimidine deaminase/5-amino-6-(5-phosphoribosylamino)uracil reductase RibD [Rhodoferax sp.]|nr:bifunctional diaminohydroxyphosphoribosylaminopyrimidine deaminase/5-amino-6-(5-phosphoribosylamino)uracil reductase RibD [Rhodoferax sp.]